MHMIKPFIFPDGKVYACPSFELAPENNANVSCAFEICDIENILEFYSQTTTDPRTYTCSFCKYAQQNELIEDVLTETEHNDFA